MAQQREVMVKFLTSHLIDFLWIIFCVFSTSLLIIWPSPIFAEVPRLINYQGRLTDSDGSPINETKRLQFNLYDSATGGEIKWGPFEVPTVAVVDGYFNVILGEYDKLEPPRSITQAFGTENVYLGIRIEDGTEISPRQKILSTPYAVVAQSLGSNVYFEDEETLYVNGSVEITEPPKGGEITTDTETGITCIRGSLDPVRGKDIVFKTNLPAYKAINPSSWTDVDHYIELQDPGIYLVIYNTSAWRKQSTSCGATSGRVRLRNQDGDVSKSVRISGYSCDVAQQTGGNVTLVCVFDLDNKNSIIKAQVMDEDNPVDIDVQNGSFTAIRIGQLNSE